MSKLLLLSFVSSLIVPIYPQLWPNPWAPQENDLPAIATPEDPTTWAEENPECGGTMQSPINIETASLVNKTNLNPLLWTGYWTTPLQMFLQNTGHTVQVTADYYFTRPTLSGGPLSSSYTFQQLHFHWGEDDTKGSEHSIDGKKYPMEMHVVHYKTSALSMDRAMSLRDGLVVVGYMFDVSPYRNIALDLLMNTLPKVQDTSNRQRVAQPFPIELFQLSFSNGYVTYKGSLTTPPCTEIVTWIIPSKALPISEDQLNELRDLYIEADGTPMDTFRPAQPLNGRTVNFVP